MNRFALSWILGLPAAAFGIGAAVGHDAGAAPVDLKGTVAVVDVEAARAAFPLEAQRMAELKGLRDRYNQELVKLEDAVKAADMEIQAAEEGTERRDNLRVDREILKQRYQMTGEKFEAWLAKQRAEMIQEVNEKLRVKIADFAQKKGYQLVLRVRGTKGARLRQRVEIEFAEDLLYHSPALDVTEQLKTFLRAN